MSLVPPLPNLTPPPANSSATAPPPSVTTPSAPPPATPSTPPASPPPPLLLSSPPPPVVLSPPPVVSSPPPSSAPPPSPPIVSSPPPTVAASPPPPAVVSSPPPQSSPSTPAVTPPPPQVVSPPSPPESSPSPPAATTPPPKPSPTPPADTPSPPKPSPSTPAATPPPSDSPPATSNPPPALSTSPPTSHPTDPSSFTPPTSLPVVPKEKPTAKPTDDGNTLQSGSSRGIGTGGIAAIGVIVGLILLSLFVLGLWFTRKRKRKDPGAFVGYSMPSAYSSPQGSDVVLFNSHSSAPKMRSYSGSEYMYASSESGVVSNQRSWFSYDELAQATSGFSEKNLLGEGGFGCVYKGVLGDGREVAVKQLKIGGSQGEREFKAEVEIISRVHHRHLVTLVGYCISEQHRLLVYDYVPNNTLHYHLHAEGRPVMTWATRVRVAAGAARGIAYLHEDCHPRIIHRDIKSSNILLDNSFEALVADFGLAKIAQELDLNTHVSTRVMGTFGYMAPEYATSGKLSEKADVYSYGVILLELITGRKPVDTSQPLGDESLVEWARPLLSQAIEKEEFDELVDQRLGDNFVPGEMFRMIEAAAACVRHSAGKRPKMSQVVRALDTLEEAMDITNGMKPGESQVFDSRQQSAQIRMFQRMAFGSQDYSSDFFDRSHSHSSWGSRDKSRFVP